MYLWDQDSAFIFIIIDLQLLDFKFFLGIIEFLLLIFFLCISFLLPFELITIHGAVKIFISLEWDSVISSNLGVLDPFWKSCYSTNLFFSGLFNSLLNQNCSIYLIDFWGLLLVFFALRELYILTNISTLFKSQLTVFHLKVIEYLFFNFIFIICLICDLELSDDISFDKLALNHNFGRIVFELNISSLDWKLIVSMNQS